MCSNWISQIAKTCIHHCINFYGHLDSKLIQPNIWFLTLLCIVLINDFKAVLRLNMVCFCLSRLVLIGCFDFNRTFLTPTFESNPPISSPLIMRLYNRSPNCPTANNYIANLFISLGLISDLIACQHSNNY